MKKIIHWLDTHLMSFLTLLFLIIVPLYPKFPFFKINDTYISVRLEDFYVGLMALTLAIQLLRKRVRYNQVYAKYIILFWSSVILSFLFNYFISEKIFFRNIGALHAGRRVEYMIPFFVAYAGYMIEHAHQQTTKAIALLDRYLKVALFVVILVSLYAIGQRSAEAFQPVRDVFEGIYKSNTGIVASVAYFFFRFFDFPAVQTMNAEFAKGSLLNLTPFSRVSSTFAGHYDLAAYLVFFIPIIASYIMRGVYKVRHMFAYVVAIFTLILTASRISFGAYVGSIVIFFVYTRRWKMLILTFVLTAALMYTNSDMTQRFRDMFQKRQVFENVKTGQEIINQDEQDGSLPAGSQFIRETKPAQSIKKDQKALKDLKRELILKEIDEARKSGKVITEEQAAEVVSKKYKEFQDIVVREVIAGDTSFATRTQVEWPRAWNAFLSNPLLGTGPSSITESTDGDLFRWLGETGLAGTILFIIILGMLFVQSFQTQRKLRGHDKYVFAAYCAGLIALGINALLIDVFEASKVAFTFWTLAGLYVATMDTLKKSLAQDIQP